MSFINQLNKEQRNIIICPSSYNEGLFSEVNKDFLFDVVFKPKKEFLENIFGSYTEIEVESDGTLNGVIPLFLNKGYTVDAIENIISNMPLISDKYPELEKFHNLNEGFINYYKDKNILYTMDNLFDPVFLYAIKYLSELGIELKQILFEDVKGEALYKEYENIIKEVEGASDYISYLLLNGVDINKIKVQINGTDYKELIRDVFSFYPFKNAFYINDRYTLFEKDRILSFFNSLKDNKLDTSLETLNSYKEELDVDSYNVLANMLSGTKLPLEYFKYKLQNSYIKQPKYNNAIEVGNVINRYLPSDTYLIILGANSGLFPKTIVLSGELTDNILKEIHTSDKDINTTNEKYYLSKIYSLKHVYISSYLKGTTKNFTKSPFLFKILDLKEYVPSGNHYSKCRDYLKFKKAFDEYVTYGSKTSDYKRFSKLLADEDYKKFTNIYDSTMSYTDFDNFKELVGKKLMLSYSKMNEYNECPFKYYYGHILKLDPFENSLATFIGNFFHKIMENYIDSEFPLDEETLEIEFEKFIKTEPYKLTIKDRVIIKMFYSVVIDVYYKTKSLNLDGGFKVYAKELEINKVEDSIDDLEIEFNGKIDLVLKDDNDNTIVVDYKTGHYPKTNYEKGTGLQQLVYFNVLKETNVDETFVPAGFIFEVVPIKKRGGELKKISCYGELLFDSSVNYGEIKVNKQSWKSKEEIEDHLMQTKEIIEKTKNSILSLDFKQSPGDEACDYCSFKEVCYKYNFENDENEEDE